MNSNFDQENCQINGDHYNDGDQEQLVDNEKETKNEMTQLNLEEEKKDHHIGGLKLIVFSSIVFALSVTIALMVTIYVGPDQVPKNGAVATNAEVCANIGTKIIKDGGSTVDSVVATAFCEGVVNIHLCGIGGGGFVVIRDIRKSITHSYDFHSKAPNRVDSSNPTEKGQNSVAIPGFVSGMKMIHDLFGKLSWNQILQPTIDLAKNGFNNTMTDVPDVLAGNFSHEEVKLPQLAALIEQIALKGTDAFYKGGNVKEIQDVIGKDVTVDDFTTYKTIEKKHISTTFNGYTIDSLPAPSGGPGLLFLMKLLESFGFKKDDENKPTYYNNVIEALKFMSTEFTELGDSNVVENVTKITKEILSDDFITSMKGNITTIPDNPDLSFYEQFLVSARDINAEQPPFVSDGGLQITAIGADDFLVSLSLSLGSKFGSGLVTSSGVVLNNHLKDFVAGSLYNEAVPGKRPQSHLSPVVVYNLSKPCGLRLAAGGGGGEHIPAAVGQALTRRLLFSDTARQSIKGVRVYSTAYTIDILAEDSVETLSEGIGSVTITSKVNETVDTHNDERINGSVSVLEG